MHGLGKLWVSVIILGWSLFSGLPALAQTDAEAQCKVQVFNVVMGVPLSSRINRLGDPVEAVLPAPLNIMNTDILPAGTHLYGVVSAIEPGKGKKKPGRLQLSFSRTAETDRYPLPFAVMINTPDAWLTSAYARTPVWQLGQVRSTRMLTDTVRRRLGTDRSVWAQILGLNTTVVPDPTTDHFMQDYNKNDVLVGAGDTLQLRTSCH